jgi:hypothetical protein
MAVSRLCVRNIQTRRQHEAEDYTERPRRPRRAIQVGACFARNLSRHPTHDYPVLLRWDWNFPLHGSQSLQLEQDAGMPQEGQREEDNVTIALTERPCAVS